MDIHSRLTILHQIYDLYDEFSRGYDMVCEKGCASCCTQDVTMTTIEGYNIFSACYTPQRADLFSKLKKDSARKRFSPRLTLNELAGLAFTGRDVPPEDEPFSHGPCSLLTHNECPIYESRPFGCRCFFSKERCGDNGHAIVDPLMVTANNVFLQYIEHVDTKGYTANLAEILLGLETAESREHYSKNQLKQKPAFAVNKPLTVLLIPPEHKAFMQPLLRQLNAIKVPKAAV